MVTALIPESDRSVDLLEIERLKEIIKQQNKEIESLRVVAMKYAEKTEEASRLVEWYQKVGVACCDSRPGDYWHSDTESSVRDRSADCSQRKIGREGVCFDMTCKRHGVQPNDWRNGFGPY